MRELAWMAAPRQEWFKYLIEIIAASVGVSIGGGRADVLPYNPAILQGLAGSEKG